MTTKILLAIETSCDETSIAVLRATKTIDTTEFETLSHIILSQAQMHAEYGGVFPTMARRDHQNNITALVAECLDKAGLLEPAEGMSADGIHLNYLEREEPVRLSLTDFVAKHPRPLIDAIAVTSGPGLEPALWVGVSTAKALADYWQLPLVPVNHMEGHILSVIATDQKFSIPHIGFPALALLISGGHTEFVRIDSLGSYTKIGQTRDDAIGEAFDKVARLLGLPYPGGPEISKLASEHAAYLESVIPANAGISSVKGEPSCLPSKWPVSAQRDSRLRGNDIVLPRPMMHSKDYDFSFSGIKTATRYLIESLPKPLSEETKQAIAHEFESAVTEVLVTKTCKAINEFGFQSLIVAGGVAANTRIRNELANVCQQSGVEIFLPNRSMAMDNALMIGIVGALKLLDPDYAPPEIESVVAHGNWHYKQSGVFE